MAFHPPAYTSVPSRQALFASSVTTTTYPTANAMHITPAPQPDSAPRKIAWSTEVRDYVQRSFAPEAQGHGIAHNDIEVKLKEIITGFAEANRLDDINWKEYPLPSELIRQERARIAAFQAPVLAPWTATPFPTNTNGVSSGSDNSTKKRRIDESSPLPWRNPKSLEDRITPANGDKRQKHLHSDVSPLSKFDQDLERRRQRFNADNKKSSRSPPWHKNRNDTEHTPKGPVVGTCERLEKNYFRLTSAPKPEEVRPLPVLEKTLELLKTKWRKEGNYAYICDQFKSLRQDLTVQHIKNSFTVDVYEIHARIALEKGDLGEYNQCQTQLRALYSLNLGGHPAEFLAYRILYFLHTCNRTALNDLIADLTPADKEEPAVKHALSTRSALALGNYHQFFRLYLDVPNMGAYLMDMFVARERLAALCNMCKAFKPKINIRFLTEELGFENNTESAQFLVDHGAADMLQELENDLLLDPSAALPVFEAHKAAAFQKVDIKGQI